MGWNSPGYHHLIMSDGTIHNLQPIERSSNGAAGFNANSIHISYISPSKDIHFGTFYYYLFFSFTFLEPG